MAQFFNLFYLVILVILNLGRTEVTTKDEISTKNKTNISIIEAPILEVPSTFKSEHEKKIKITTVSLCWFNVVIVVLQSRYLVDCEKFCKKKKKRFKSNPPTFRQLLKVNLKTLKQNFSKYQNCSTTFKQISGGLGKDNVTIMGKWF